MKRRGIALAAFMLGALALLSAVRWMEYRRSAPVRGASDGRVGQLERLEFGGQTYVERPGMTSILLLGIDSRGESGLGAHGGGQADFLLLLAIDHGAETIRQLQIDRDAIAEVETTGLFGNRTGTRNMQICQAQVFGTNREQNCANTRRAVERMLGVEVDCCVALNMDAIAALNDLLGGVVMTLSDDFSDVDPQMVKGVTLRFSGAQAEKFVCSRMEIGDGTNLSRMRRQQAFIAAATAALRERLRGEPAFIEALLDALQADMTADKPRNWMLSEANRVWNYEVRPIETLPGRYVTGGDGFVEFYPSIGAAEAWVVSAFYRMEQERSR